MAKPKRPIFIAEIKTKSPFGFRADHSFFQLMDMAVNHGDWISVHVDALYGGDVNSLSFVRQATDKPILAKGLHNTDDDIQRSFDHGADYVLVVDRIPNHQFPFDRILLEPRTLGPKKADPRYRMVCNSRDLITNSTTNFWEQYRKFAPWLCQASNITSMDKVKFDADAFIVGSYLPLFLQNCRI